MKKLLLLTISLVLTVAAFSQNYRGYSIEAFERLEAKKAFVIANDTLYNTTQLTINDTILVTLDYLRNLRDSIKADSIIYTDNTLTGIGTEYNPLKVDTTIIATINDTRQYIYESEIAADGQTTIALPWDLKPTSTIFYEDSPLRLSEWSGAGTAILTLLFTTKKYEYSIIKR